MTDDGAASAYDVDVVVVGSGFGGSVAALRLAEKGYQVTVFEAGRRFEDEEFAKTSWDVRRYFWAPRLGCYGVQRIHKLPDVVLLAGAGVGGGSLNYANTLYVPPKAFFDDPQWRDITDWAQELAPHYDQAARMLGVVENPCEGPVEEIMRAVADDLGVGHTFRKTPVGVFFGRPDPVTGTLTREPGRTVADPYFGGAGPAAHRVHGVRQLHGRVPGRRQEHAGEELPGPGRRAGSPGRADAHRRRRAPAGPRPPGARLCGDDRAHRRLVRPRPPHSHCGPGGAGRRHVGHPEAAALDARVGRAARPVRPARRAHPHQLRGPAWAR